MLVATNVVQEVSRPVSSDNTRNINIWLEKECVDCAGRRKRSGLNRRLESVNWSEIAEGRKCSDVVSDNRIELFENKQCSLFTCVQYM